MSRNLIAFMLLGFAAASQVHAVCPISSCTGQQGTSLNQTQISNLLNGNTVCAILGNERWQEWHSGSSVLELGNDANGEVVGTWSTSGAGASATVVYSYGTGGSGGVYTYSVCQQGSNYDFCGAAFGGRDVTNALVKTGKGGC